MNLRTINIFKNLFLNYSTIIFNKNDDSNVKMWYV